MAQTRELIKTLKKALKAQGKTYVDVAVDLGLTEASVKRLFSKQSFSSIAWTGVVLQISDPPQSISTNSAEDAAIADPVQ